MHSGGLVFLRVGAVAGGVVGVVCFLAGCGWQSQRASGSLEGIAMLEAAAWLENPLGMQDATVRFAGVGAEAEAEVWDTGTHERTAVDAQGRLVLDAPEDMFPAGGVWTSPVIEAALEAGVTEVLPSMNLEAPGETGVRILVRVRQGGAWSPWLDLEGWGELRGTGAGSVTSFKHGGVEIDWVKLSRSAGALQLRLELVSFDTAPKAERLTPAVKKLVAVYSGKKPRKRVRDSGLNDAVERGDALLFSSGERIDMSVPMFRQGRNGPALGPRTCSPTSLTMVMGFHGVELAPRDTSEAVYDRRYRLFGNWGRAVAFASTRGLDAELQRFRSWDDVRGVLASGVPVVASIRFEQDEFPSNRMKRTGGHLIVVRGLTETGDAIVNDPAYSDGGEGVVYKKEELARAWLGKGGVGYVVRRSVSLP